MGKVLSIITLISLFMIMGATTIKNEESISEFFTPEAYGIYSIKDKVTINNTSYDLLATYNEPQKAMENFKRTNYAYLRKIQKKYDLDELNSENYYDYYYCSLEYYSGNCDEMPVSDKKSYHSLCEFIDIYENNDNNKDIIELCKNDSQLAVSILSNDNNKELDVFASYATTTRSESFNAYKGSQYAQDWATSRNTNYYYSFSRGDCANFMSQILEAGGVKQIVYNDASKGWWHKRTETHLGPIDSHSQSWATAWVFANYQGKYMKTNNLRTFSGKLLPGDFIGLDETGDGDVNHVGFVTHTGTYKTYNGKYYKDFKVAQHTTDYCEWVSAEKNHWEDYDGGKSAYYVLRRSK